MEMWDPWVPMELQALGVRLGPVDQRAPQGCLEEWGSLVLWVRRVNQGILETQDPQEFPASLGPKEK